MEFPCLESPPVAGRKSFASPARAARTAIFCISQVSIQELRARFGSEQEAPVFSSTAESFGVSAQIGSGVVRGGPEVRFHQGSTSVPPRFHQGLRGGPGWFEQGFHQGSTRVPPGSTRFPPGFHQSSTRVAPGSARAVGWFGWFDEGSRLRGGPGWFEEGVPPGSTRVPPGFHQGLRGVPGDFDQIPPELYQGCTRFCKGCGVWVV